MRTCSPYDLHQMPITRHVASTYAPICTWTLTHLVLRVSRLLLEMRRSDGVPALVKSLLLYSCSSCAPPNYPACGTPTSHHSRPLATTPFSDHLFPYHPGSRLSIAYIAFIFSTLSCTNYAARLEFATSLKITIRFPAAYTHASHNLYHRSSPQPISVALSFSSPLSRRGSDTERRHPE